MSIQKERPALLLFESQNQRKTQRFVFGSKDVLSLSLKLLCSHLDGVVFLCFLFFKRVGCYLFKT